MQFNGVVGVYWLGLVGVRVSRHGQGAAGRRRRNIRWGERRCCHPVGVTHLSTFRFGLLMIVDHSIDPCLAVGIRVFFFASGGIVSTAPSTHRKRDENAKGRLE